MGESIQNALHEMRGPGSWKSSSGGADFSTAPALLKPDERISRIRLTRILSVRACTGSATNRSQQAQTKVVHQVGVERPALRGAVTALTPTSQMMTQSFDHIQVELVEATAGVAVAKVATPSFQEAIHLVDQLRDRHEVPLPGRELANALSGSGQRLVEGVRLR